MTSQSIHQSITDLGIFLIIIECDFSLFGRLKKSEKSLSLQLVEMGELCHHAYFQQSTNYCKDMKDCQSTNVAKYCLTAGNWTYRHRLVLLNEISFRRLSKSTVRRMFGLKIGILCLKIYLLENHITFLSVAVGVSFYGKSSIDHASRQLET